MKSYITETNGSIEWVDKETLRYSRNGFSVLVWIDFEPGIFSRGRIIKASSIVKWDARPDNSSDVIDTRERRGIIDEIQKYYNSQNEKCRVEE